jgi:hypothetical protein
LSDATQSALEAEPDLDIETAVQWLVGEQIIAGFTLSAAPSANTPTDAPPRENL